MWLHVGDLRCFGRSTRVVEPLSNLLLLQNSRITADTVNRLADSSSGRWVCADQGARRRRSVGGVNVGGFLTARRPGMRRTGTRFGHSGFGVSVDSPLTRERLNRASVTRTDSHETYTSDSSDLSAAETARTAGPMAVAPSELDAPLVAQRLCSTSREAAIFAFCPGG